MGRTSKTPPNGTSNTTAVVSAKSLPIAPAAIKIPLTEKARIMKGLNGVLPTNDYGLPDYVYRGDLIPLDLESLEVKERQDVLDSANLPLDYSQGFPTLGDGEPFWGRLPWEPVEAFSTFVAYLDMPRKLGAGADLSAPIRQVHMLTNATGKPSAELLNMYHVFYWGARTRAYDMFISVQTSKVKEYRLQEADNRHYQIATSYIEKAEAMMANIFANPDDHELTPKETFDLLMKMVQLQRLSLGVAPFSPRQIANGDVPKDAPLEVILRTIAQSQGIAPTNQEVDGKDQGILRKLYEDPTALAQAQELIIRLGNPGGKDRSRSGENHFQSDQ